MNISTLLHTFRTGITWNALFFVFYKLATTGLTFCLFYTLSGVDFATWANTNSLIFLLLLWLDFGLRKSIPRYAPFFANRGGARYRTFVGGLAFFQLAMLTLTVPLFIMSAQWLSAIFQLPIQKHFLRIIALIFFTEGCVALMRLLFHAHFWIKQFNTISMVAIGGEVAINLLLIYGFNLPSQQLLVALFIVKSSASILLLIWASYRFFRLYRTLAVHSSEDIGTQASISDFVVHSVVLGAYTNIKSLSERNFLMPFFTFTLGAPTANIFKIANETALLLYRAVLKTIGTADTALLTHAQLVPNNKNAVRSAFIRLRSQLLWLCIPLIILVAFLFLIKEHLFFQPAVTQAFFIMVIGYLLEALLSPYERLLEVQRRYGVIALAYTPYCLALLYAFSHTHTLELITVLILFHATRLAGSSIIALIHTKTQRTNST